MRQLILSVVMFAFASLLFTPAAVASERLWATSTAPGGEESFTRLKTYYEREGVADNRGVQAVALTETALAKAYENPNMPSPPTENVEAFKAALTLIFMEKNTLRVDSDGDVTWSNFMSVGSRNSGFAPLTAADIQRAISLSTPAEPEVEVVDQEVAEDQIAPVIPGQPVLGVTVIDDTSTPEATVIPSEPLVVPGAMTAFEMVAAASSQSTPAATPVVSQDDTAQANADAALGIAGVAARQSDTNAANIAELRGEIDGLKVRTTGLEIVQGQLQEQAQNNTDSVLALAGRMEVVESGVATSKTALSAARGEISALNGRISPLEESTDSIVLKDGSIVGIAGIIALIFLVWFFASRFRIRKKFAEELAAS